MGTQLDLYDLTGRVFGRLTVIGPAESDARRHRRYRCVCVCGGEITTRAENLRHGDTTSCGCARVESMARARQIGIEKRRSEPRPVRVPPPPESQTRALRMLPVLRPAGRTHAGRLAILAANSDARTLGVERRHDCANYEREDRSGCMDALLRAHPEALDARCPRSCPHYETDEAETREGRMLAATVARPHALAEVP